MENSERWYSFALSVFAFGNIFKKALALSATEQLDLKLGGEKKQFSKGLQRCAGAVQLWRPRHPPL